MGSRNVRGRMLYWKISHSRRVNALSGPWPMLLYTWLIPCQDNLGRMEGDADVIKGMVFPKLKTVTVAKVETWLSELHEAGLLFRWSVQSTHYLQVPDDAREEYQKIVGNMREDSDFPVPPEADYKAWCGQVRTCSDTYEPVSTRSTEGKRREEKGSSCTSEFDLFWKAYPRKVGKAEACKSWERIKPDAHLLAWIMKALARQKESADWKREFGKFIPHPKTWLNQKLWEDDPEPRTEPTAAITPEALVNQARIRELTAPIGRAG